MPENFNVIMQQQQIPRLNQIQSIRNYFNQESSNMNNNRYINNVKAYENAKILSLNPHGCRPFDSNKMCILKQAISRLNIDIILMNKTCRLATRWLYMYTCMP